MKKNILFLLLLCSCIKNVECNQGRPSDIQDARAESTGHLLGDNAVCMPMLTRESGPVCSKKMDSCFARCLSAVKGRPLMSVDEASGIIVTDWFNDSKVQIFVKGGSASVEAFRRHPKTGLITMDQSLASTIKKTLH